MSKLDNRPAAVVTGGNRGLGLELCRQLQAAGWRVVALCRRSSPELEALGVAQIEEGVDVGSDDCVALLRQRLAGVPVGLLICNAGVLSVDSVADLDIAVCREQFEVNALGPLRVVHALQPNLQQACSASAGHAGNTDGDGSSSGSGSTAEAGGSRSGGGGSGTSGNSSSSSVGGSKVAIISSKMGSIAATREGGKNGSVGYRLSKAAANMAGQLLALELQPLGIPLVLIHPGAVATDIYRNYWAAAGPGAMAPSAHGAVSPQAAVAGVLQRVEELTLECSGRFVQAASREVLPW